MVSDMKRSVAFYRDQAGLPLKFESSGWTEFQTEGSTIALHLCKESALDDNRERPGTCRPGWSVSDLDAYHSQLIENKVTCVQPPTEVFGARVAQYQDPDGLTFSVGEDRG